MFSDFFPSADGPPCVVSCISRLLIVSIRPSCVRMFKSFWLSGLETYRFRSMSVSCCLALSWEYYPNWVPCGSPALCSILANGCIAKLELATDYPRRFDRREFLLLKSPRWPTSSKLRRGSFSARTYSLPPWTRQANSFSL